MTINRRNFLKTSALLAAASAVGLRSASATASPASEWRIGDAVWVRRVGSLIYNCDKGETYAWTGTAWRSMQSGKEIVPS